MLREGERNAVCIALLSLIDRRLAVAQGASFQATERGRAYADRQDLDGAVLRGLIELEPWSIEAAMLTPAVQAQLERLQSALADAGMALTPGLLGRRRVLRAVAVVALVGMAGVKCLVALSRGHSNVGFLLLLAWGAVWASGKLAEPSASHRTRAGSLQLVHLQDLYRDLRRRSELLRPGDQDIILLAAVYGMSWLPHATYPHARLLVPLAAPPPASASDGGDSSDLGDLFLGGGGGDGCGGGGGGCGGCGGH